MREESNVGYWVVFVCWGIGKRLVKFGERFLLINGFEVLWEVSFIFLVLFRGLVFCVCVYIFRFIIEGGFFYI